MFSDIVIPSQLVPTSAAELPLATGSFYGDIFTGFEKSGGCWWCSAELPNRRSHFCRARNGQEGHGELYTRHFQWGRASWWCLSRAGYVCQNCGDKEKVWHSSYWYVVEGHHVQLEAHHIVPLEGRHRLWSVYNLPWNLVCLCHECHLEIHAILNNWTRKVVEGRVLTPAERLKRKGQLALI